MRTLKTLGISNVDMPEFRELVERMEKVVASIPTSPESLGDLVRHELQTAMKQEVPSNIQTALEVQLT